MEIARLSKDKSSRSRKIDKSLKIRRDKSSRNITKISKNLFEILGPDVLQYGIKPFVESTCHELTQKFGCKGPMSVYIDDKGNRKDCAWKCISQCVPSDLMAGIFKLPKTIIFNSMKTYPLRIQRWQAKFSAKITDRNSEHILIIFSDVSDLVTMEFSGNVESKILLPSMNAAGILCEKFKKWTREKHKITISAEAYYEIPDSAFPTSHNFSFNNPWIRPPREWNVDSSARKVRLYWPEAEAIEERKEMKEPENEFLEDQYEEEMEDPEEY